MILSEISQVYLIIFLKMIDIIVENCWNKLLDNKKVELLTIKLLREKKNS